jgi:hypothetical protein
VVVVPFTLKRWKIETIASYGFLLCGLAAFISVFYKNELYAWLTVIPFAISNAFGFTAFATVFSNCGDKNNQGWAMGILAATVALAYVVSGFSTNLLPFLGGAGVIEAGGICGIISGFVMFHFSKKYSKAV